MKVSAKKLKWLLRFYPPFFFQRIVVKEIHPEFLQMNLRVKRSLLTRNLAGTTFGGTIFSATDPLYALLLSSALERRGLNIVVWLKHARIDYLKPAATTLHIHVELPSEVVDEAVQVIESGQKYIRSFEILVKDASGEVCARVENQVYMRRADQR